jgi:hypothetical protein
MLMAELLGTQQQMQLRMQLERLQRQWGPHHALWHYWAKSMELKNLGDPATGVPTESMSLLATG